MKAIAKSLATLSLSLPLLLSACARLPDDGANAKLAHYENLHLVRYIEVFVVGGNGITGNLLANVYNTTFAPGLDLKTKDSAPPAYVQSLNLEAMKKQFGALAAKLNGPKLWMLDWVDIPLGAEEDINGMRIPWCATLRLTKDEAKEMGKLPYVSTTIERRSKIGYNKGTLAILIDDAQGTTWIMKGFELGLKPQYSFEEFVANAASRFKKLPPGWSVRTKVLDQDLILVPATGVATIMPDEFFNVYDKTGPGYSSYKP